jgi:ABC-type antimicrobial peptide transport system ATPase subunit
MNAPASFLTTFASARQAYEQAWNAPAHTRFELPPVNVNRVLRDRYQMEPHCPLTRTMIWDMETKKAWDPLSFIPYVVSEGGSWGRHSLQDGASRFCRASMQKGWISPNSGRVLEDVYVSDAEQAIYFLGRERMIAADSSELRASEFQPIFHVHHGVGGTEDEPLNLWSIVLLTQRNEARYEEPFKQMVQAGLLPGFIEIYIERNLGVKLKRK